VEYKHLLKMAGRSYLGGYHELVDERGYLHPSVNPLGARTGRMAVAGPPLQTLHRDALVRDGFIPSEDSWFFSADYDQQEVRLTASISGDPRYVEIVKTSRDLHTTTAAQIYNILEEQVTKPIRQRTKNVVYAKLYGAGPPKFAHTAGISIPEAREFMAMFDRAFPAVAHMMAEITGHVDPVTRKRIRKGIAEQRYFSEGVAYVKSPLTGRHHKLADHECRTYVDGDGVEWLDAPLYKLVNYLIQGTGAEVIKRALVNAEREGIDKYIAMVVHDEIIWDVPKNEADVVQQMIPQVMEDHVSFAAPLTVGCERLERWGDKYAHTRGSHLEIGKFMEQMVEEVDFEALDTGD
jgi:DNA polymerase-1